MTTSALKNRRRQDIDRTRGHLGDTLEELTHKIQVPARIWDKVHDAKQTVVVKTDDVMQQTQVADVEEMEDVQAHVEDVEQVHADVEEAEQAHAELPSPVAEPVEPLVGTAKQRQLPAVAVAVALLLLALLVVLRRLLCRNR